MIRINIPSIGVITKTFNGEVVLLTYFKENDIIKLSDKNQASYSLPRDTVINKLHSKSKKGICISFILEIFINEEMLRNFLFLARWHRIRHLRSKYRKGEKE